MPRRVWRISNKYSHGVARRVSVLGPLVLGQAQDPDACQAVRACNLSCAHQRTKDLACQLERPQGSGFGLPGRCLGTARWSKSRKLQMDIGTKAAYAT
jgi:hypothetical protein